jgi:hypothetical protein
MNLAKRFSRTIEGAVLNTGVAFAETADVALFQRGCEKSLATHAVNRKSLFDWLQLLAAQLASGRTILNEN